MSEILLIRLPKHAQAPVNWLITDASGGELIASGVLPNLAALAELSERASSREVYVAVAGEAVSMHQAAVPAKSRRHLQQIIPFTLEDDVAEDIGQLHFAWPSQSPNNEPIPVAVVARQQMTFWLAALAQANIAATQLVPDFLLLPYEANCWTLAQVDNTWLVRQSQWQGASVDPAWLPYLAFEEAELPTELLAIGDLNWPQVPAPVRPLNVDLPLFAMVQQWRLTALNLCQGEFAQHQPNPVNWQQVRWPAIAAAILCVVYLANLGVTWLQLDHQTQQVQQNIEARYLELFPEQQRLPADARRRMEQQVAAFGGATQGELLGMLNDLVLAFQDTEIELTLLQFDSGRGELRVQATGKNFQTFERFQRAVRAQALEVEQGQLVSRAGKIAGTLTIRRPS